jgi:hypothetical protein
MVDPAAEGAVRSESDDELDRLFVLLARQRDELKRRQVDSDRRGEELEARAADLDERERRLRESRQELERWTERLLEIEELHERVIELATTLAAHAQALRHEIAPEVDAPDPARSEEQPV